jgi:hypothetical protein
VSLHFNEVFEDDDCREPHQTGPWSDSDCDQYWGGYILDGQKVETFRGNWQDPYGPESVTVAVTVPINEGELGNTEFEVEIAKKSSCIECKITEIYPMTTYQVFDAPPGYWRGPFGRGPGICPVIHEDGLVPSAERVSQLCSLCEDQLPGGFIYDVRGGNGTAFVTDWLVLVECNGQDPYYTYAGYRWDAEWVRDKSFTRTGERICAREEGCAEWIKENYPVDN